MENKELKLPAKYAGVTLGPWSLCNSGKCSCKFVWSKGEDGTVATARPMACVHGEWGDDIDMIYGEIPKEQVDANALLISDAPRLAAAVVEARKMLDDCSQNAGGDFCLCFLRDRDMPTEYHAIICQRVRAFLASTSEWAV